MFMYLHVHSGILNSQKMEATQVSIDEWMNKKESLYTLEYYPSVKRKEILTWATAWMNLEDTTLCELSQSQKAKYCQTPCI